MDQEQIKELILHWEKKYPVDEWKAEEVHLWPYLRIKLYYFLLNLDNNGAKENFTSPQEKDLTKKTRISKILQIPKAFFTLLFFFQRLRRKNIIFFGSHIHRTRHGNLYFNRFFDPMIEKYQLEKKVYLVEFQKVYDRNFHQETILPLNKFLTDFKLLQKLRKKDLEEVKKNLPQYGLFYEEVVKAFEGLKSQGIREQNLIRWALKIHCTNSFFKWFYKQVQPEKIIFMSYYGFDDLAAAILAAKEMGIKTIDFQHGPQTGVHMAYTAWTKFPAPFYNTMPDEYWNWDIASADNIRSWSENTKEVKAKVVGHPYIAYWKTKNKMASSRKNILYSLQAFTLEESFPEKLLNIIHQSKFHWTLRLHPRGVFEKKELTDYLIIHDIHNCTVESAVDQPLPVSLMKSNLHLTFFSGTLIEAQMMGVPTLLIHETGQQMFRPYINNRDVFYIHLEESEFQKKFEVLNSKLIIDRSSGFQHSVINPLLN